MSNPCGEKIGGRYYSTPSATQSTPATFLHQLRPNRLPSTPRATIPVLPVTAALAMDVVIVSIERGVQKTGPWVECVEVAPVVILTSAAAAAVARLGLVLVLIMGTEGYGRCGTVGPTLAIPYSNPLAEKGAMNRLAAEKGKERGVLGVGMRRKPCFEQRQRRASSNGCFAAPAVSLAYVAYLFAHFRAGRLKKATLNVILLMLASVPPGSFEFGDVANTSALRTDTARGLFLSPHKKKNCPPSTHSFWLCSSR